MRERSKRYKKDLAKVETREYKLEDAVGLLKKLNTTKFDQTVEVALHLSLDAKKSDQTVRGAVALPKGIGKTRKVIVFADGEEARVAKDMGADEIGTDDLVKKITDGWTDFDIAIALPRMMKVVGKLGKVLGPQGKMPSPKSGTVTDDIKTAVKEFKAGKIEYRADAQGNLHAPVGKLSFSETDLHANVQAFIEHIIQTRPVGTKGHYIRSATVSAAMSPGLRLEIVQEHHGG